MSFHFHDIYMQVFFVFFFCSASTAYMWKFIAYAFNVWKWVWVSSTNYSLVCFRLTSELCNALQISLFSIDFGFLLHFYRRPMIAMTSLEHCSTLAMLKYYGFIMQTICNGAFNLMEVDSIQRTNGSACVAVFFKICGWIEFVPLI